MRRFDFLIFATIVFTTSASFSEEKTYLSTDERLRPLSLPRKTWKFDIGAEFAFGQKDNSFEFDFDPSLLDFQFPHLPIGERAEIYFLTPVIKFYPVKNSIVQDNALMITGTNFSIFGGITSIGYIYSQVDGSRFYLDYGLGYQFKWLLGEKSWLFSNGTGVLDLNMHWSTNITLGRGYQITDKFYIITSVYGSLYEYRVRFIDTGRLENHIGYTLKVPIDFKFNKKINRGYMIRTGFTFKSNTYNNKFFWGIPIGLQYSWHW